MTTYDFGDGYRYHEQCVVEQMTAAGMITDDEKRLPMTQLRSIVQERHGHSSTAMDDPTVFPQPFTSPYVADGEPVGECGHCGEQMRHTQP